MEWLNEFGLWVWERHHNILSWYVRPLFIIPLCYFAYRRNIWGIIVTLLIFPTSLFWFPAPAQIDPQVQAYLAWELEFLTNGNIVAQITLLLMVIGFFTLLLLAFWKRNWLYGLAVLNIGTLLKVVWSVLFAGDTGWAALLPSIITLAICDTIIIAAARWLQTRRARIERQTV